MAKNTPRKTKHEKTRLILYPGNKTNKINQRGTPVEKKVKE